MAEPGMMLQVDGSPHDWLEGRGDRMCLQAAIDDATGEIHGATFREEEDAIGYLTVFKQVAVTYGVPVSAYHDRHTIFGSTKAVDIEAHLAGIRQVPSHVGRALQDLEITSIPARSPQAKGRIERLFGTLQDRLVTVLRLAGVSTMQEANQLLPSFVKDFNRQFGVPARSEGTAYRAWPANLDPDQVFCFKFLRTVGMDNTVRFEKHRLQVLPGRHRLSYAKCRVEVHKRIDGSIRVFYEGKELATAEAPPDTQTLRARDGGHSSSAPDSQPFTFPRGAAIRKPWVPPPDHPWRSFKLGRQNH